MCDFLISKSTLKQHTSNFPGNALPRHYEREQAQGAAQFKAILC
jgi:hypothetical protein